ncbi:MAG: glycosyltransferase family 87 protein [Terriglobia bacterium]
MNDFIEYWTAVRLLMAGQNPYSAEWVLALQRSVGWTEQRPLMMWNPPWTLSVILPFGLLSFEAGRSAWLLFNLCIVFLCADLTWRICGGPKKHIWLSWVVSLGFFPSLYVLRVGQITPLILLGVVGFMYFAQRGKYGLASSSAVLIFLKPHLLYLFWVALILWVIHCRKWKCFVGFGTTLAVTTLIPLSFNPSIVLQFFRASLKEPPLYWMTPTLGGLLRYLMGPGHDWLQFLPMIVGLAALLWVWCRHGSKSWDWSDQMPLLLLVSVSTAAYGWSFDQVVLIPAIIQATLMLMRVRRPLPIAVSIATFVLVNGFAYGLALRGYNELSYVWMAPTLLICFLVVSKSYALHSARLKTEGKPV